VVCGAQSLGSGSRAGTLDGSRRRAAMVLTQRSLSGLARQRAHVACAPGVPGVRLRLG
jgi:hypothetical protein